MIPNATDSNLFRTQDPSVQRAAGGTAPAAKANLDDYNPFDKTKASTTNGAGDSAAVMDTAPPQYTTSGQQQVSAADFQVRDETISCHTIALTLLDVSLQTLYT